MIGIPEAAAPLDPWLGTSIIEIKHDILPNQLLLNLCIPCASSPFCHFPPCPHEP